MGSEYEQGSVGTPLTRSPPGSHPICHLQSCPSFGRAPRPAFASMGLSGLRSATSLSTWLFGGVPSRHDVVVGRSLGDTSNVGFEFAFLDLSPSFPIPSRSHLSDFLLFCFLYDRRPSPYCSSRPSLTSLADNCEFESFAASLRPGVS